jgi:hypothetical protein
MIEPMDENENEKEREREREREREQKPKSLPFMQRDTAEIPTFGPSLATGPLISECPRSIIRSRLLLQF